MATNLTQTSLPTVVLPPEQIPEPLGRYGVEILRMMERDYTDRYWQLVLSGTLMERIYLREKEIEELRLLLLKRLEEKYPRPKTDSFLKVAVHMSILAEAVDEVTEKELKKPV